MSYIVVTEAAWLRIRDHFTDEEKEQLREAWVGPTVSPKGEIVEGDRLGEAFRAKLKRLNRVERGDVRR